MVQSLRSRDDVTALLIEWRQGDAAALERLVPLVYAELKKVAGAHLRHEQAGHSLQATALVHEVYLRLVNVDRMTFESRAHFMAVAARLMRQILIDLARSHQYQKRGCGAQRVTLSESLDGVAPAVHTVGPTNIDVLALDECASPSSPHSMPSSAASSR
jgi:RNA polymerase sigma factor (TIGR02999 family)